MMLFERQGIITGWLVYLIISGVVWFVAASAWSPTNKLYQQGLIVLFWLPVLLSIILWSTSYWQGLKRNRFLVFAFFCLFAWSAVGLLLKQPELFAKELKRQFYIVLFLAGFALIGHSHGRILYKALLASALLVAAAALFSILDFYFFQSHPWVARLQGIGRLAHPILGGYIVGMMAVWLLSSSINPWLKLVSISVLLVFMLLTQSRGVWMAFLMVCVFLPLWRSSLHGWVPLGLLALISVPLAYFYMDIILLRGFSYRPEIWQQSVDMVAAMPLWGIGFAGEYQVLGQNGYTFDHAHNIFLDTAIRSGIPAALLWLAIWLAVAWKAWQYRLTPMGSLLCASVVFATVALIFDGSRLWGTPRPEWFLTWLPLGIALGLSAAVKSDKQQKLDTSLVETKNS